MKAGNNAAITERERPKHHEADLVSCPATRFKPRKPRKGCYRWVHCRNWSVVNGEGRVEVLMLLGAAERPDKNLGPPEAPLSSF